MMLSFRPTDMLTRRVSSFAFAALTTVVCAGLGLGSVGCTVHHDGDGDDGIVETDTGTLVMTWTLDESTNANLCSQQSAPTFQISVFASNGSSAGVYSQDCDALATSIQLEPGNYTATALLLDANGKARTTSIPVDGFRINDNVQLNIPIDFPANSFE